MTIRWAGYTVHTGEWRNVCRILVVNPGKDHFAHLSVDERIIKQ
jgi:hypothetical protein